MADRSTTFDELKEWLKDIFTDPFYYFWKQKRKPTYWLFTFIPTALFYLAASVSVIGAAFWNLAQAISFWGVNILDMLWNIGHISTLAGGFIASLPMIGPFIAPVFGACFTALQTVFAPLLAVLGLGSNPIGWGFTAILALPAIAGGVYEAVARFKNCFNKEDGFFLNALRFACAPISLPINFLYGFCRTAYHLITGKGYIGSVIEAVKNIDDDILREKKDSQFGGGSILSCLVPPIVDRALGAAIGVVAGTFNLLRSIVHPTNLGWGFTSIFGGMWRGLWSGSHAAVDTFSYYGPNSQVPHLPTPPAEAPSIDEGQQFDSKLSSYASATKHMSKDQGYSATSSKYVAAKTLAEMAVLKKRYDESDKKEEKDEIKSEYDLTKGTSRQRMR